MATRKPRMDSIDIKIKGGVTTIDKVDLDLFNESHWYIGVNGYVTRDIPTRCYFHRLVMDFPEKNVDHCNGIRHDNRRSNLRVCTQSQNTANSGKRKTNKSGYKGVSIDRRNPNFKWVANLTKDYKHIYIGAFRTPKEAAIAYNIKALEEFGEFALLNKI